MERFSLELSDKIFIVKALSVPGTTCVDVRKQLYQQGVDSGKWTRNKDGKEGLDSVGIPSKQAIRRIFKVFEETGCVDVSLLKSNVRSKTVRTQENIERVKNEVSRSPNVAKSHRTIAARLKMSNRSVYHILKYDLKLKPYIPRCRHKLSEDDPDRRLEFCEFWSGMCDEDPLYPEKILWSDEAAFHTCGSVNRHNTIYWSTDRPDNIDVDKMPITPKVTVWCGMTSETIVGPVFFEGNVTGENYLQKVLIDTVSPFMDDENHADFTFQQDGASPHYSNVARNYLNENLEGRWIGRRGAIEWPARSPDLTPLDFFLWGFLKHKVYGEKILNIQHLKEVITRHIEELKTNTGLLKEVMYSVTKRINECIDAKGSHFEPKR